MAQSQYARPGNCDTAALDTTPVRVWLLTVAALVFLLVSVGGATRLTGSGLSITEWKPIMGIVPPLSEADWQDAFDKYRQIPQYQQVNKGMSLGAFKRIFWWEWTHRFLGRLVGFAFLVPFLVLLAAGRIPRALLPRLVGIFALGGLQGFIGWYMVSSGLVDRISVSQYRLAVHLGLAILILGALLWVALSLDERRDRPRRRCGAERLGGGDRRAAVRADPARRAGGRHEGRHGLQHLAADGWAADPERARHHAAVVSEPVRERHDGAVQPSRGGLRGGAGRGVAHVERAARERRCACQGYGGCAGWSESLLQAMLGIWTLLAQVPLSLGLAHQAGAAALFAIAVWHLYAVRHARVMTGGAHADVA